LLPQASWEQFAAAEPDMAKVLRSSLAWIPICYLATVRRDGSPRVHPFCPIFAGEGMYIAIRPFSAKRHDLRRTGRFAMHSLPGKRDDEFYMTGSARLVEDTDERAAVAAGAGHTVHADDDVFELRASYVMTAYWEKMGQPDTYAVRSEWRAESDGLKNGRRKATRGASGSRATQTRS